MADLKTILETEQRAIKSREEFKVLLEQARKDVKEGGKTGNPFLDYLVAAGFSELGENVARIEAINEQLKGYTGVVLVVEEYMSQQMVETGGSGKARFRQVPFIEVMCGMHDGIGLQTNARGVFFTLNEGSAYKGSRHLRNRPTVYEEPATSYLSEELIKSGINPGLMQEAKVPEADDVESGMRESVDRALEAKGFRQHRTSRNTGIYIGDAVVSAAISALPHIFYEAESAEQVLEKLKRRMHYGQ